MAKEGKRGRGEKIKPGRLPSGLLGDGIIPEVA
jgi:hypothetical protein